MSRRVPLGATLVVLAATALMIGLGIWQLHRVTWKAQLLATYAANAGKPPLAWPAVPPADVSPLFFRHATAVCLQPVAWRAIAGESRDGRTGWKHIVSCRTGAEGPGVTVDAGWSATPDAPPGWRGGPVAGVIEQDRFARIRLVAEHPAPGLLPSAPPSPATIPNNHFSYAIQWFIFAAVGLVIYALALRRRWRRQEGAPR